MSEDTFHEGVEWDRMVPTVMTVGRLKEIIRDVPDDTHVVMDDGNGWYTNIRGVYLPSEDGYTAVTLVDGGEIDTRQW